MKHNLIRIAIGVTEAFIALSAIGGGIALLLGTYQDNVLIEAGGGGQFPLKLGASRYSAAPTARSRAVIIGSGRSARTAPALMPARSGLFH